MPTNPNDKITLLLGDALIKKVKLKSIESNRSVSEVCRIILDAWQAGVFGYEKYKNKSKLPDGPGIYVVIKDWAILYVGLSINIQQRIEGHNHKAEFASQKDKTVIFWFLFDKDDIRKVEQLCIELLEPELNVKREPAKPVDLISIHRTDLPDLTQLRLRLSLEKKRDVSTAEAIRWLLNLNEAQRILRGEKDRDDGND